MATGSVQWSSTHTLGARRQAKHHTGMVDTINFNTNRVVSALYFSPGRLLAGSWDTFGTGIRGACLVVDVEQLGKVAGVGHRLVLANNLARRRDFAEDVPEEDTHHLLVPQVEDNTLAVFLIVVGLCWGRGGISLGACGLWGVVCCGGGPDADRLQAAVDDADGLVADLRPKVRPEHGLVAIWLTGSRVGHVLTSQTATDHGMVVVLHTPAAKRGIVEAGNIPRHIDVSAASHLGINHDATLHGVNLETSTQSNVHVGLQADSNEHVVRDDACTILKGDLHPVVVCGRDLLDDTLGPHLDPLGLDLLGGPLAQIPREDLAHVAFFREDLVDLQSSLLSALSKGHSQFTAEEAATDNGDGLCILAELIETAEIGNLSEVGGCGLDLPAGTLEGTHRLGPTTSGNQQLVVARGVAVGQGDLLVVDIQMHNPGAWDEGNSAIGSTGKISSSHILGGRLEIQVPLVAVPVLELELALSTLLGKPQLLGQGGAHVRCILLVTNNDDLSLGVLLLDCLHSRIRGRASAHQHIGGTVVCRCLSRRWCVHFGFLCGCRCRLGLFLLWCGGRGGFRGRGSLWLFLLWCRGRGRLLVFGLILSKQGLPVDLLTCFLGLGCGCLGFGSELCLLFVPLVTLQVGIEGVCLCGIDEGCRPEQGGTQQQLCVLAKQP
eukprot:comp19687_c0_seq1/m.23370 comp19687_c0_seq1/g.23370  ORF comp19687_c0_seq1/g.23370 comp19687_c0_seq1/m.23370 type:complete len:663 (+) comp19687_c0_seq1:517-2505(+)